MSRHSVLALVACLPVLWSGGATAWAEGFVTRDGVKLLLDGKEYRAIGANQPDLFTAVLLTGDEGRRKTLDAVLDAEKNKIAFFRFWASGFWPVDMKLYFEDPDAYWKRMDEVFALCRQHNVKLIPSVFWQMFLWSDLCDEPLRAVLDPNSKTYAAMRKYARELVSRYKDDPNVLCWEIGNEYSTHANLNLAEIPDAGGAGAAHLGTRPKRILEDSLTSDMMRQFMKDITAYIKSVDPNHLVTSGDAHPRETSWSLRENFPKHVWVKDTMRQFLSSLMASQPEPLDVMSVHHYGRLEPDASDPSLADVSMHSREFLTAMVRCIHASRTPVLVGELGCVKPSVREDPQAHYIRAVIDLLEAERASLVAIWAWHFPWQEDNDIRGETHPVLMKRIIEFNEKYAGM